MSEHKSLPENLSIFKKIILFTKFTVISIAWNNLTPFVKVGGEPLKYKMLTGLLRPKDAASSTINYNIIHLLSTVVCFIMTALVVLFYYKISKSIKLFLWLVSALLILIIFSTMFLVYKISSVDTFQSRFKSLRLIIINIKFTSRVIIFFYRKKTISFYCSLFLDVLARFVEGLTFYFGFLIVKHPISLLNSSLIEIGRTFVDTIFFFIPFQIGTRERGVGVFMEKILVIDPKGFLSAVILYRLVEITWILIGYILWLSSKISATDERT